MYYEKILRLYNLPESNFNLISKQSDLDTSGKPSRLTSICQDNLKSSTENISVSEKSEKIEANSIENLRPIDDIEMTSSSNIVDCFKCNFTGLTTDFDI